MCHWLHKLRICLFSEWWNHIKRITSWKQSDAISWDYTLCDKWFYSDYCLNSNAFTAKMLFAINLALDKRSQCQKHKIIKIICNSTVILSRQEFRMLLHSIICVIVSVYSDNLQITEMRLTTMNFRWNSRHPVNVQRVF